jgi:nuclear pore complex protein Nup37
VDNLQLEDVVTIKTDSSASDVRQTALAWSPLADGRDGETAIRLTCASSDFKIQYINSDHEGTTATLIGCHKSYINSLAAHPTNAALVASGGDDRCCVLWNLEAGKVVSRLQLKHPCVEVAWHPQEPMKLLVADKSRGIHFYDMNTQVPIMTLDITSHTHQQLTPPLLSVDWLPSNYLLIGGVANGHWAIWDVSQSRYPLEVKSAHNGPATAFRWCSAGEQMFATIGNHGNEVKVHHLGHQKVPISTNLPGVGGISWHATLPLLAASSHRSVRFWGLEL